MSRIINFTPQPKQEIIFKVFGVDRYLEILYGGAAGSGKSYIVWALMVLKAIENPGIRIGFARQTLVQIKKTSMTTFNEVISNFGLEDYYTYNENKGLITFNNGSVIQFFELRYLPTDSEYDRFGGALLTFGVIEEANGVESKGKEIFSSRLGRWKNDQYNIPAHLFMTTNPGTNFVYHDFYKPFTDGTLAKHRLFIPATIADNKKIGKRYADSLSKRLGKKASARLLAGDWNFDDDKERLFKYEQLANLFNYTPEYHINVLKSNETEYLSADIAFTSDKTRIVHWKGNNIIKVYDYNGEEPDKYLIELSHTLNIKQENIVYDSDGVGKYIKGKLPRAKAFINNGKSTENFENLKAECYFKLADEIDNIKIFDETYKEEIIQELYEFKSKPLSSMENKLGVISKDEIKKQIGRSPDTADAIFIKMSYYIKPKATINVHVR